MMACTVHYTSIYEFTCKGDRRKIKKEKQQSGGDIKDSLNSKGVVGVVDIFADLAELCLRALSVSLILPVPLFPSLSFLNYPER